MDITQLVFLVVEDHEFQRNATVKMLKSLRAKEVHAAADGRAALELLKSLSKPVDVIISDLDMPAMDGLEFIRHIGRGRYGTSLIVASALERGLIASVANMAAAYSLNLLGTIEKPVTPRKLEELIKLHQPASGLTSLHKPAGPSYTPDEIVEGLQNDEFEPYYQPKIDIASGAVIGA